MKSKEKKNKRKQENNILVIRGNTIDKFANVFYLFKGLSRTSTSK